MAVYILGAGASCCTDSYQDFTAGTDLDEDFRPPVMNKFVTAARSRFCRQVPLSSLNSMLEPVGLSVAALEKGEAACANVEHVLSFCDLLQRAIAHWAFGGASPPDLPPEVVKLCAKVRGWPIFGGCPEGTLVRAAEGLRKAARELHDGAPPSGLSEWESVSFGLDLNSPIRDALRAICEVYAPTPPYMSSSGSPGLCSNYSGFLANKVSAGDTVVTFDYDFLLDRVLEEKADLRPDKALAPFPTLFQAADGPARFLKLHGSVLWYVQRDWDQNRDYYLGNPNAGQLRWRRFCEACGELHLNGFPWLPPQVVPGSTRTFAEGPDSEEFRKCKNEPVDVSGTRYVEPLIVPPTIAKEAHLTRPEISQLWRQAERDLSTTDQIYVIGYSFPPADKHVTDMTQAAPKRRPDGSYEGVPLTIVTRPDAPQEEIQELKHKAGNAFPAAEINVAKDAEERTIGFSEWVKTTAQ